MIEKIILDYLTGLGVKAYMEIPEGVTVPPYCVIERTGGGGDEPGLNKALIVIKSYGVSLFKAAVLNELVKSYMEDIAALPEIASCDLNSDYNFTDTAKKQYRYQAVYDLVYYD